jgi:uncharacterized protein (TIGR02996 family)
MPASTHRPARPEVLAFLADIKDHPNEDGLRLIFADWLDEYGDELDRPRAELIRCQIEYARMPAHAPERLEHGRRQRSLQQQYTNTWLGPLAAWGQWSHQRGLVSGVLDVGSLRSHALAALAGTEAWAWVEELFLTDVQDSDIARLGANPLLSAIGSIRFPRSHIGPAGAQALAALPLWQKLSRLDLSGNDIGDEGLRALLAGRPPERLLTLDLCRAGLRRESGHHLAAARWLPRLEQLHLEGNQLGDQGAASLAHAPPLTGMDLLQLRGNAIGDAGAIVLARSPALAPVGRLNLADNQIGRDGALALTESPYLENIGALVLWGNPVGPAAAAALVQRFGARVFVAQGSV